MPFYFQRRNEIEIKFPEFAKSLKYENSFKPNHTSALLDSSVCERTVGEVFLDIGCGNGAIGLYVKKLFPNTKVFGIDSSLLSLVDAASNSKNLNLHCDFLTPNALPEILAKEPNTIANDVSGISRPISVLTDWFSNATASPDADGIELALTVFNDLQAFGPSLCHSTVYFPVISLANRTKLLDTLSLNWHLRPLKSSQWPAPTELRTEHALDLLATLKSQKIVEYEFKFGIPIFKTEIWCARLI